MSTSLTLRGGAIVFGVALLAAGGTSVASAESTIGDNDGSVSVGGDVAGSPEGGPGLVDKELLYSANDSSNAAQTGAWSATAALDLRVGVEVAPDVYTSTITLSLFE